MIDDRRNRFAQRYPRTTATIAIAGLLALAAVIVVFAWNSFAVPVFELAELQFREALGLTLLLAITAKLLAPGRRRGRGHRRGTR